ncbi:50S ribosomal protein L28 [Candidatus Roizmanbacteria bacterium CG22_combo_CG10-13_8_21_14_all_38_20]|uniref:Large ribosomal subunit protein bL28 n=1 Tax=Candidatus Roizmanbacteria bacterium CG22_combo_CG10-13_8_21_14_all_38_20 TaxID=1974862 RepID=A0A2H0BUU2_9BACT|nr:MAG: 50S ribosomal protein L28 [Candidatus Roizmanbacteria bacterium CG22_combo_CG10-13_8_21_14_all_38_20]
MAICQVCTKSKQYGHNVSHSHRVTNRTFDPNIITKRVFVDGKVTRVKICSKCLKRVKKYGKTTAKDNAILSKNVITLVDWQKGPESKTPEKITKPVPSKAVTEKVVEKKVVEKKEEISIEDLVGGKKSTKQS